MQHYTRSIENTNKFIKERKRQILKLKIRIENCMIESQIIPYLYEIKLEATKIINVSEKHRNISPYKEIYNGIIGDGKFLQVFKFKYNIEEEYILCAILGIQRKIGKFLIDIDKGNTIIKFRSQQTDRQLILEYMVKKRNKITAPTIQKNLEILGFTNQKATSLSEEIIKNSIFFINKEH